MIEVGQIRLTESPASYLHRNPLGDVLAAQVPSGGAAQIVEVQFRHTRLDADLFPTVTKISYRCAVRAPEQAILETLAFDALEQQFPNAPRHRDLQSLFVLRRPWFKSNDVGMGIDLLYAHLEERSVSPSRKYSQLQTLCLLQPHPGFGLHKSGPHVVLLKHRNVRHELDFWRRAFGCQMEHTLERSQRAIDS